MGISILLVGTFFLSKWYPWKPSGNWADPTANCGSLFITTTHRLIGGRWVGKARCQCILIQPRLLCPTMTSFVIRWISVVRWRRSTTNTRTRWPSIRAGCVSVYVGFIISRITARVDISLIRIANNSVAGPIINRSSTQATTAGLAIAAFPFIVVSG